MKRKLLGAWVLIACGVWAAGCRSELPVDAILTEVDAFTDELVGKVTKAADPSQGVDEAQKLLDRRRDELAAKIASVKRAGESRNDDEIRKKVMVREIDNGTKVSGLQTKFISRSMEDAAFKEKLDKLVDDYQLMFKV
jgi:hypothetical protein